MERLRADITVVELDTLWEESWAPCEEEQCISDYEDMTNLIYVFVSWSVRPDGCSWILWPQFMFVDRQASSSRRLGGHLSQKLFWFLGTGDARIHFRWIRFEKLSFREQVALSAKTDVLMIVHRLSHVLWIRKPGALIEIFPGMGNRLLAYQQFWKIWGLLYYNFDAYRDSSSGVVYREGSCTSVKHGNRLSLKSPPSDGAIEAQTMNQIEKRYFNAKQWFKPLSYYCVYYVNYVSWEAVLLKLFLVLPYRITQASIGYSGRAHAHPGYFGCMGLYVLSDYVSDNEHSVTTEGALLWDLHQKYVSFIWSRIIKGEGQRVKNVTLKL